MKSEWKMSRAANLFIFIRLIMSRYIGMFCSKNRISKISNIDDWYHTWLFLDSIPVAIQLCYHLSEWVKLAMCLVPIVLVQKNINEWYWFYIWTFDDGVAYCSRVTLWSDIENEKLVNIIFFPYSLLNNMIWPFVFYRHTLLILVLISGQKKVEITTYRN